MKKFHEFLLENEMDDLRMDLMGLGFTRWEVVIWGEFEDEEWQTEFNSKGKGDSKEEAAEFALSAILDVLYPTNYLPGKRFNDQMQHEIKGIRDFRYFEEEYGIASDLVKKTLSDSLYTQNLYKGIYEENKLTVEVRVYEGLESGGIIRYEYYPQ
jgi:hypothetical protein